MKKPRKKACPFPFFSVVRDFRVRLGKSQAEVARACSLTANDMSRLESGKNIRLKTCRVVASYLGISVDAVVWNDFKSAAAFISGPPMVVRTLQDRIQEVNAERNTVGNAGEDWVYECERRKLAGTAFADLVNPNYANDPDSHFDILSYDADTFAPKMIEVKSTKSNNSEEFFMSNGELELLNECVQTGSMYELHRVEHALNPSRRREIVYSAERLLAEFDFVPVQYAVRRKELK